MATKLGRRNTPSVKTFQRLDLTLLQTGNISINFFDEQLRSFKIYQYFKS